MVGSDTAGFSLSVGADDESCSRFSPRLEGFLSSFSAGSVLEAVSGDGECPSGLVSSAPLSASADGGPSAVVGWLSPLVGFEVSSKVRDQALAILDHLTKSNRQCEHCRFDGRTIE